MYSDWVLGLLLLVILIWLLVLTNLTLGNKNFLKSLFPKGNERDIRLKFKEVLQKVADVSDRGKELDKKLEVFENNTVKYFQKFALLRYNPYADTGGDQSFSLALLNNAGDGIVLTSLHSRSETRIFAKPVEKGKAINQYPFSREEEKVIEKALG